MSAHLTSLNPAASLVVDRKTASCSRPNWSDATLAGVLALCAALPYANTLLNGFVYDDVTQITHNPYLASVHHLREILSTTVWSYVGAEGVTNYYRPMMTLGYLVCYQLFGPVAYEFHLVNVALHAAVVMMLFAVTRRVSGDRTLAFVAALLFALHPIHSESVAWIAAVTDVELTFFYLLTFFLFLGLARAEPSRGRRLLHHGLLAGSFILALLSKEQALTLPFLAAVYEHLYRDDRSWTSMLEKVSRYASLWLLGGVYLLFRVRVFGALAPASAAPKFTRWEAALSAVALIGEYARKLVWPRRLSVFYVFHKSATLLDPRVLVGLAALLVLGTAWLVLWRRGRTAPGEDDAGAARAAGAASFGIVWLLATLAPVLNVRWMPINAFAERYLYLPSVGFCWLAAWALTALWRTASRRGSGGIAREPTAATRSRLPRLALVGALGILAALAVLRIVTRNRDFRNEVTLFTRTLETAPDAYPIRNNLGVVYWSQGDAVDAEREWRESLKLAPDSMIILNNLGMVCAKQKRYPEAVDFYQRSIRLKPDYTNPHLNLGVAYEEMGLKKQAESEYEVAVRLSPLNIDARNRLGKLYLDEARFQDAEPQFLESVKSQPNPMGFVGLGDIYVRRGLRDLASRAFRAALKLNPYDSHAHFALAAIAAANGNRDQALREFEAGLTTDPANSEALAAVQRLKAQVRDVNQ
ncbi:MAG TPA: tetratricopeptide repeat protein [Terriglobia bacterium]|nr:tetratricopeptide repeat protein [Terriglobia bacterium]